MKPRQALRWKTCRVVSRRVEYLRGALTWPTTSVRTAAVCIPADLFAVGPAGRPPRGGIRSARSPLFQSEHVEGPAGAPSASPERRARPALSVVPAVLEDEPRATRLARGVGDGVRAHKIIMLPSGGDAP